MTLTQPTITGSDAIYQSMIDTFGTAGTVAISVITAAVALGVITALGTYSWRLFKKWLASAK